MIGTATAIGLSPRDVWEMTLFEFHAAVAGWNRAQGEDKPEPMSADEFEAMVYADAEREAATLQ